MTKVKLPPPSEYVPLDVILALLAVERLFGIKR